MRYLFAAGCLALCACSSKSGSSASTSDFDVGNFHLHATVSSGALATLSITHESEPSRALFSSVAGQSLVGARHVDETLTQARGSVTIADHATLSCDRATVQSIAGGSGSVTISGQLTGAGCGFGYEMIFSAVDDDQLGFRVALGNAPSTINRVYLRYASSAGEEFYGFGEQFTDVNVKGKIVPILVQEQGIGRTDSGIGASVNALEPGSNGNAFSTYIAVPFYLTSAARSLYWKDHVLMSFDLSADDDVVVDEHGQSMSGVIVHGTTPPEIIERYTRWAGRMAPLPDWINQGAVVGLQGGTDTVTKVLAQLQTNQTPIAALWLQDWVGQRTTAFGSQLWWNWQLDQTHYPNWSALLSTLAAANIRVMTYVNPFVVDVTGQSTFTRNLYQEAAAAGYLVKNRSGMPYPIDTGSLTAFLVDLTNPDAVAWYKELLTSEVMGAGASGWMADFGEWLPFDCVLASGVDPVAYHNQYAQDWAQLNHDAVAAAGKLDDIVYFMRSGFSQSPGNTRLFWLGDQLVDFDPDDGLQSAVKGMLSAGLSGFSLEHSDIGGYTTFPGQDGRSEELLDRWMEVNAFTAVFRTHEGNAPSANVQVYSSASTLAAFARMAKVYTALAPYRVQLMADAAAHGWPLARPLLMQFFADAEARKQVQEWMLGSDFLVAPALDMGVTTVHAYLPAGQWVHVWSGQTYSGGQYVDVPAPIGQPPVFYVAGSTAGANFVQALNAAGIM